MIQSAQEDNRTAALDSRPASVAGASRPAPSAEGVHQGKHPVGMVVDTPEPTPTRAGRTRSPERSRLQQSRVRKEEEEEEGEGEDVALAGMCPDLRMS